jgi:hypothetical protein
VDACVHDITVDDQPKESTMTMSHIQPTSSVNEHPRRKSTKLTKGVVVAVLGIAALSVGAGVTSAVDLGGQPRLLANPVFGDDVVHGVEDISNSNIGNTGPQEPGNANISQVRIQLAGGICRHCETCGCQGN